MLGIAFHDKRLVVDGRFEFFGWGKSHGWTVFGRTSHRFELVFPVDLPDKSLGRANLEIFFRLCYRRSKLASAIDMLVESTVGHCFVVVFVDHLWGKEDLVLGLLNGLELSFCIVNFLYLSVCTDNPRVHEPLLVIVILLFRVLLYSRGVKSQ